MNKTLIVLAAILVAANACTDIRENRSGDTDDQTKERAKIIHTPEYAGKGRLIIRLSDEALAQIENISMTRADQPLTRSGVSSIDNVLDQLGVSSLERVFTYIPKFEDNARRAGLHRWYIVYFSEDVDLNQAARQLSALGDIETVEFDVQMQRDWDRIVPHKGGSRQTTRGVSDEVLFNDPLLPEQWNYNNSGSSGIASDEYEGADINANPAWRINAGDPQVIVAIVDEGIKYTHPDLKDNMWVNEAELKGQEGVDDDGNGYIDDIYGMNFVTGGPIGWSKEYWVGGKNIGDSGHGTHVAGTVAAVNNNGIGVAGVAGGSGNGDGVRLMSCQIMSGENINSTGSALAISRAIRYAADMGASIIQCSYGYASKRFASDIEYTARNSIEKESIDYFTKHRSNCPGLKYGNLAIFAAGNDGAGVSAYPAAYRDYISVTAFGPDFLPAYYTNYGPGCNIAAPGGNYMLAVDSEKTSSLVLSTMPSEVNDGEDYGFAQGTSMACPHVSGVAALGLSYAVKLGKRFTLEEFRDMLLTSVNDIDGYVRLHGGEGYQKYIHQMGSGAVDAFQLLMQIEGTPCLKLVAGKEQALPLSGYFGESYSELTYTSVEMDESDMKKMGLKSAPQVRDGQLVIECARPGTAKVTVKAIAGGECAGSESVIGGIEVSKTFAIISRSAKSENGGWL